MSGTNLFALKTATLDIALTDESNLAMFAKCTGAPPTTASVFAHGAICIRTDSGTGVKAIYENVGSSAVPSWNLMGEISTEEIGDGQVTQVKMEEGSMVFVDKQLTNAEVLALRATPIELVAAPGADKAIVVHKFAIVVDDTAGAFTESTDNLVMEYEDGVDISAAIEATSLVGGAVQFATQGVLDTVVVPDVNAGVQLLNTGDGEWGGGNVANTISVRVWYSVIDTIAFS